MRSSKVDYNLLHEELSQKDSKIEMIERQLETPREENKQRIAHRDIKKETSAAVQSIKVCTHIAYDVYM